MRLEGSGVGGEGLGGQVGWVELGAVEVNGHPASHPHGQAEVGPEDVKDLELAQPDLQGALEAEGGKGACRRPSGDTVPVIGP
jgi:hypothetical protein